MCGKRVIFRRTGVNKMRNRYYNQIRKKAQQQVFREFVLPLCNELLEYDTLELSDIALDVFYYIRAVRTYIMEGEYTGRVSDYEDWKLIAKRIEELNGNLSHETEYDEGTRA